METKTYLDAEWSDETLEVTEKAFQLGYILWITHQYELRKDSEIKTDKDEK